MFVQTVQKSPKSKKKDVLDIIWHVSFCFYHRVALKKLVENKYAAFSMNKCV